MKGAGRGRHECRPITDPSMFFVVSIPYLLLLHLGHSVGRPLLARMRPYSRHAAVSATTAIQRAGRYTAPLVADVEFIQSQLSEADKVRKQKATSPTVTAATPTRKNPRGRLLLVFLQALPRVPETRTADYLVSLPVQSSEPTTIRQAIRSPGRLHAY